MNIRRFCDTAPHSLIVVVALAEFSARERATAQDHTHMLMSQAESTSRAQSDERVPQLVRESTERFRDVSVAENEGYGLLFGCVSGSDYGAMGLHFVNMNLVGDGEAGSDPSRDRDLRRPLPDGRVRITGADYLVLAADWDAKHSGTAPSSWDSSFISSRAPIASGFRRSTRCTCGRGRTIRTARVRELAPQGVVRIVHAEPLRAIEQGSGRASTGYALPLHVWFAPGCPSRRLLVFFSFAAPAYADPIRNARSSTRCSTTADRQQGMSSTSRGPRRRIHG